MMCPHCGKSIPDGADKCPHCGEATDFARRSHYRETDSPLQQPTIGSAESAERNRELQATLQKENARLRQELDETASAAGRASRLALGAILLAALCLGLSLFTLLRSRDVRTLAQENSMKLEEMRQSVESREQALQEQLTEVKNALDSLNTRLTTVEADMFTGEDMKSWSEDTEKDILGKLNGYLDELKEIIGGVQEGWDLVSSLFGLEETGNTESTGNAQG